MRVSISYRRKRSTDSSENILRPFRGLGRPSDAWMDGRMDGRGRTDGRADGRTDADGWTDADGRTDGRGQTNGRGRTDGTFSDGREISDGRTGGDFSHDREKQIEKHHMPRFWQIWPIVPGFFPI